MQKQTYREYKQNQGILRYHRIKEQQEQAHRTSIGIILIGGMVLWLILLLQGGVWQN